MFFTVNTPYLTLLTKVSFIDTSTFEFSFEYFNALLIKLENALDISVGSPNINNFLLYKLTSNCKPFFINDDSSQFTSYNTNLFKFIS